MGEGGGERGRGRVICVGEGGGERGRVICVGEGGGRLADDVQVEDKEKVARDRWSREGCIEGGRGQYRSRGLEGKRGGR